MAKKDKSEILLPPISGGSSEAFKRTIELGYIEDPYRRKVSIAKIMSLIAEPFRAFERRFYYPELKTYQIKKSPIFVLGHWRSGTTFLHNLISQDPQMSYITTYQSTFPELVLNPFSKAIFKTFMRVLMPNVRRGDNVKLDANFPQEEEFMFGNLHGYSFYNMFYFPNETEKFYRKYIQINDPNERAEWKKHFTQMIKVACKNTGKDQFISKNPPHTGRIPLLLEVFPKAKFIYIYRNPFDVFLSTRRFFWKTMENLKFQEIEKEALDKNIINIYKKILKQYLLDKSKIKENHLFEISFENFEKSPAKHLQDIYGQLNISGYETALPHFKKYLEQKKVYKKNKNKITKAQVKMVRKEWAFAFKEYGYDLPDWIEVSG